MSRTRTRWGLMIAAGLAGLLPAASARAQVSYGYDSLIYIPTAQSYFDGAGYSSIYTDPTTGMFVNGMVAPPKTVAPYAPPPYGTFGANSGLSAVPWSMAAPAPRAAVNPRPRRAPVRRSLTPKKK